MSFKETYSTENISKGGMRLEPQNGWYEMYPADQDPAHALTIGICFNSQIGNWGYWDYDPKTKEKEWIIIEVPESDRSKVKREIPYTAEERAHIEKTLSYYEELFRYYAELFK